MQKSMDEKIYVAVGGDLGNKSTLEWAIQNTGGKEFYIVHVLQLPYRKDKEKTQKIMDKYLQTCTLMQVHAEKIFIEMESVTKGLIQLISERNVKKLVMGAASDRHYKMGMADLLSKKAIYILKEAPATCCIWFTCKGHLVYTREAILSNVSQENASTSSSQDSVRSRGSVIPSGQFTISRGNGNVYRLADFEAEHSKKETSFVAFRHQKADKEKIEAMKKAKEWESVYIEELKRRKETEMELKKAREDLEKYTEELKRRKETEMELQKAKEDLEKYMEELKRRKETEMEIKKAREDLEKYTKELKRRKETEMELKKAKEDLEKMRYISENRITESNSLVQKLQDRYNLATKVLRKAKIERDGLIRELNIAIAQVDELRIKHENVSRSDEPREAPQYFICPISLEVMEDPRLAADGFTYEAEAISKWLESGHETSPMTNKKLLHQNLVPNLALRSAIQEWLQASSSPGY